MMPFTKVKSVAIKVTLHKVEDFSCLYHLLDYSNEFILGQLTAGARNRGDIMDQRPIPAPRSLAESFLRLEKIDRDLYRSTKLWKPVGGRGVFGGQVVGQALVAAGHTKPDNVEVHSIHCYFIRAGQASSPIIYNVERLSNGKSFSTRLVKAVQNGEAILTMQVSYHRHEEAVLTYQSTMPRVPSPDELLSVPDILKEMLTRSDISPKARERINLQLAQEVPIELRPVDPGIHFMTRPNPDHKLLTWVRAKGDIGDDENLHRCIAAYLSDMTLLRSILTIDSRFKVTMMVSLDHTIWFHAPFRADEWMLYECVAQRAVGNRGLALGRLWKQNGTLAISVAQEGLIRGEIVNQSKL